MKSENRILLTVSLLLFAYMALRAYYVPVVHDEVGTFLFYIQNADFWPFSSHHDANNHFVNSALSSVFIKLLGVHTWVLRLSNLLVFPLFLWFSYKLAAELKNRFITIALVLSLWFAQYFIEFFALSRGYGMSMGFYITTLYFAYSFAKRPNNSNVLLALLFNALAFSANLSLLNNFLLINAFIGLVYVSYFKTINKWLTPSLLVLLGIVPGLFWVKYLFVLKKEGLLYYGSTDGFYDVTLKTVAQLILGTDNNIVLAIVIALFALAFVLYILYRSKAILPLRIKPADLFPYLLVGNITIIILLAKVLGINYPEDRVGIYLFPLLVLSLAFVADNTTLKAKWALVVPMLYMPIQFVFAANLTHSHLWQSEHLPERFFNTVLADAKNNDYPPIVSGYKMRTMVWAYYNREQGGLLNQIQEVNHRENLLSDFIISDTAQVKGWEQYYTKIDYDPISNLALLKRRAPLKLNPVFSAVLDDIKVTDAEYINLYENHSDTLGGKSLLVKTEALVTFANPADFECRFVFSVEGDNKLYAYNYYQPDWNQGIKKDGKYPIKISVVLNNLPADARHVKVYFWNTNKAKLDFTKSKTTVELARP